MGEIATQDDEEPSSTPSDDDSASNDDSADPASNAEADPVVLLPASDVDMKGSLGARVLRDLCHFFFDFVADFFCVSGFLLVFSYNCLGPNKQYFYIIQDVDNHSELPWVIIWGMVNLAQSVLLLWLIARYFCHISPSFLTVRVENFLVLFCTEWFWLVVWMMASTTMICGVCMVMHHDGMDLSLKFEEWSGTRPFR